MGEVRQNTDTVALNGAVGLEMKTMKTATALFNLDIRYNTKTWALEKPLLIKPDILFVL